MTVLMLCSILASVISFAAATPMPKDFEGPSTPTGPSPPPSPPPPPEEPLAHISPMMLQGFNFRQVYVHDFPGSVPGYHRLLRYPVTPGKIYIAVARSTRPTIICIYAGTMDPVTGFHRDQIYADTYGAYSVAMTVRPDPGEEEMVVGVDHWENDNSSYIEIWEADAPPENLGLLPGNRMPSADTTDETPPTTDPWAPPPGYETPPQGESFGSDW